jgi:hypothetical protein
MPACHVHPTHFCQITNTTLLVFSASYIQEPHLHYVSLVPTSATLIALLNMFDFSVSRPDEFLTYLQLATLSNPSRPLVTFWTTSSFPDSVRITSLLHELISSGVGEDEGGVSFCEVEYDSFDIRAEGLGWRYNILSAPTLLSFYRGEPRHVTKITDLKVMADREKLSEWIREEAGSK